MTSQRAKRSTAMGPALVVAAAAAGVTGVSVTWAAQGVGVTAYSSSPSTPTTGASAADAAKAAQLKAQIKAARAQLAAGAPTTTVPSGCGPSAGGR